MNMTQLIIGRNSLYLLIGYVTSCIILILQASVKTPFYCNILSAIQHSPVMSFVISLPCLLILGMLVDSAKQVIQSMILKQSCFDLSRIPQAIQDVIHHIFEHELHHSELYALEDQLLFIRRFILPEFDEYKVFHKWLCDFLENLCCLAIFSFIVIGFRSLAYDLEALDWALASISILVCLFAIPYLKPLRMAYTEIQIGFIVREYSKMVQDEKLIECIQLYKLLPFYSLSR